MPRATKFAECYEGFPEMTDEPVNSVRRATTPLSTLRPIVSPIFPAVAYAASSPDTLDAIYEGQDSGYTYAREGHPNADILASKIDQLEGVENGIITGSGMSAVAAALIACTKSGEHIVAGDQLYGRSLRLLSQDFPRLGITASLADPTDIAAFKAALRPETKAILLEVVSNPTLRIADMEAIAQLANETGTLLIVDNTFTTPRGFQPIARGADIVIHSVTKLLAGHSDVTLGYVAAKSQDLQNAIRDVVVTWGMTPSPQECWLAERGLYSFDLRFQRTQENAAALADHIARLNGVAQVYYPGRTDHPDHNRVSSVLGKNFGNMLSFRLNGGRAAANALTLAAPNIAFAPTLGDIGTTISHPASSSHRGLNEGQRNAIGITEGFFRISVGIEDIDALKSEFTTAIEAANRAF